MNSRVTEGLPEFSFNLIDGLLASGKTTFAHQIMFAIATPERPALFFTVLGETPLKMLQWDWLLSGSLGWPWRTAERDNRRYENLCGWALLQGLEFGHHAMQEARLIADFESNLARSKAVSDKRCNKSTP